MIRFAPGLASMLLFWMPVLWSEDPFSDPPLKVTKYTREAIRSLWEAEGDPKGRLRGVIERFQPDLLITLDPHHRFTGHVEHQLASRLVNEVLHSKSGSPPGPKHLTVFHILNRYAVLRPFMGNDPGEPSEQWDLTHLCGSQTCVRVAAEIAREHRSQLMVSALGLFVLFADQFKTLSLYREAIEP